MCSATCLHVCQTDIFVFSGEHFFSSRPKLYVTDIVLFPTVSAIAGGVAGGVVIILLIILILVILVILKKKSGELNEGFYLYGHSSKYYTLIASNNGDDKGTCMERLGSVFY